VVFIFAKTPSDALAGLVKEIEKVVSNNEEKKIAAVVNFTGEPTDEYLQTAKEFGEKHNIQHVALSVTQDAERFEVSEEAEVTVMHYKNKSVKFNLAVGEDGLDEETIQKIVEGTETILD
jgi:hypothetical protein